MSVRSMNSRLLKTMTLRRAGTQRGFTLIEIMVVVVILGILAAIVVPNVFGNVEKARISKVKQDIRSFETALALYKMDNFKVPTSDQGCLLYTSPSPRDS